MPGTAVLRESLGADIFETFKILPFASATKLSFGWNLEFLWAGHPSSKSPGVAPEYQSRMGSGNQIPCSFMFNSIPPGIIFSFIGSTYWVLRFFFSFFAKLCLMCPRNLDFRGFRRLCGTLLQLLMALEENWVPLKDFLTRFRKFLLTLGELWSLWETRRLWEFLRTLRSLGKLWNQKRFRGTLKFPAPSHPSET